MKNTGIFKILNIFFLNSNNFNAIFINFYLFKDIYKINPIQKLKYIYSLLV